MQIVAVVAQSRDAVRRFIEETGLPFNILVDESRDVVKAYFDKKARMGKTPPQVSLLDRPGK